LIVTNRDTTGYAAEQFYIQWSDSDSKFQWGIQSLSAVVSGNTFAYDTWHHVALVRNGSTVQLYVNGVAEGTATTYTGDVGSATYDTFYYGLLDSSTSPFEGYLDEIRVSNSARYTSAFTPTTTQFVGDTNTVFLTHGEVFPIVDDIGPVLNASVTAEEIRNLLDVDQAGAGGIALTALSVGAEGSAAGDGRLPTTIPMECLHLLLQIYHHT